MTAAVCAVTFLSVCALLLPGYSALANPPSQKAGRSEPFGDTRLIEAGRAFERGDYAGSLRRIKLAAKAGAPKAIICASETEVYHQASYLDLELASLLEWAKLERNNVVPMLKLFSIYFDLGWTVEADQASRSALQLAPREIGAQMTRAKFFYRSDEPLKAIPFIDAAIKLDPTNEALVSMKASILIKSQKPQVAIPLLRKALKEKPDNITFQIGLANALIRTGKPTEAQSIFQRIQQLKPDHLEAAYQLGEMAEKRSDWQAAIKQYERIVLADPRFNNVSFRLGNLYVAHGKPEEGRKLLALYKKLDANTAQYNQTLTRLRGNSRDSSLHYKMAEFHLGTQDYPRAIVELQRVLSIQPVHPTARQELIRALTAKGRATEANALQSGISIKGKKP